MDVGTEWLIDAFGCCSDQLADVDFLRGLCGEMIAELELHVVGEAQWHKFPPPGGVTALYLLTESHLALHTYPGERRPHHQPLLRCRPRPNMGLGSTLSVSCSMHGKLSVRVAARGGLDVSADR